MLPMLIIGWIITQKRKKMWELQHYLILCSLLLHADQARGDSYKYNKRKTGTRKGCSPNFYIKTSTYILYSIHVWEKKVKKKRVSIERCYGILSYFKTKRRMTQSEKSSKSLKDPQLQQPTITF